MQTASANHVDAATPLNIDEETESERSISSHENKAKRATTIPGVRSLLSHRGYNVVGDSPEETAREYRFPEVPSMCDYGMHPFRSSRAFASRLSRNFGWRFCVLIGCMYYGVKGLLLSIAGLGRLAYCKKSLKIDGGACQTMGAIASTPWAIKGAIGVLSDAYPLFGYHKASYIMVTACLGAMAFLGLAALPISTPMAAAVLLFFANLEIATADLLCEGKYAELMQERPHTGSTMVSYVWGLFQLGSLTASLFVGPLADAFDPQIIFWVCVPVAASIIIPVALGFLQDERVPADRRGVNWALMRRHPYMIAYCLIMAAAAMGNAAVDTVFFDSHGIQLGYALSCTVLLSVLAFLWLPKQLARCNFYMFISNVLYVSIGGAQDFWFTADSACVPGGPAFDYTYYNTYTSIVGACTGWLGIVLFQATMSGWSFRRLFWVTTLLQVVASAFDMLIINRWNISVGISDKVFYMFGDAVIGPAVGMFAAMPALVLTSKLVPKGLEATVYALLAGFQNFGGVVSSQIGLYAMQASGIKTTVPCNFENLPALVGVCHCVLPLLAVPLTFWLIPDKLMTDRILDEDEDAAAGDSADSAAGAGAGAAAAGRRESDKGLLGTELVAGPADPDGAKLE